MWLSSYKNNNIKPTILIDCRNFSNYDDITSTYKLAKESNINKGLIFSMDNIFFAFYFLKGLNEFKENPALIYSSNNSYFVFDEMVENSFKILDIIFSEKENLNTFDWVSGNFEEFENSLKFKNIFGNGLIKFDNIGYIVINIENK